MAFTSTGSDISLTRNDTTGRFDFTWDTTGPNVGNPHFDDTRAHAVLTTLVSHKRDPNTGTGGYYWDDTGTRGTLLYLVNQDRLSTGGNLQSYAQDGGQQLINLKFIQTFSASAKKIKPGSWILNVFWSSSGADYNETVSV